MKILTRYLCCTLTILIITQAGIADAIANKDPLSHRYEFKASTFSLSSQSEAAISVDRSGNRFTAVWSSRRQQEGRYGIYAQRFAADGTAIGSETTVNLWTKSHQTSPSIASDRHGGQWIVWQSHGQDGDAGSIIARHFDENFVGSSEIKVNQQWQGNQSLPLVAVAKNGEAMIVWYGQLANDLHPRIFGRVLDPEGNALGDEFTISYACDQRESTPGITGDSHDGFAVVYAVVDEEIIPDGIRMQRFDAMGDRVGEEISVCDIVNSSQIEPVVVATGEGYVVAWLDASSDQSGYEVMARRIDGKGSPLGDSFVVNTTAGGSKSAAAIAAHSDGSFVIAYNGSDSNEAGIFAQMFAPDGARLGEEFTINKHAEGKQAMRRALGTQRLGFMPDGSLVCAWSGDGGFGDSSSVNITMLTPNAIVLTEKTQGVTDQMKPANELILLASGPQPHEPPTFNKRDIEEGKRIVTTGADIGFTGVFNTGWTPPDPHMAVGPDHVVVMTNGAIAFFTKDGTLTFQDEIEDSFGFWGSVGATGFVFDPEILYDELSGRFFAMAAEAFAPGNNSYVLIAVSDDSNPNGSWHKYRLLTTSLAGNLFDSPNIGVDADTVYITGDGFGNGANYPIFVYDKASMLVGNPPAQTNSFTLATATQSAGIPPVSYDNPPALYMIEHREGNGNSSVRLIALQDALTSPAITTFILPVDSYGHPEDPPQSGTSNRPETFDARFWSVAYRNGSLWATHHVSNPVRARWYEIAMNGWPDSDKDPELVQSGDIVPASGVRTFFSSITVSDLGHAAMTFARSSTSEFISMSTAYRLASDPMDTFRPDVIAQVNSGPYTLSRWGDYSAVQVDPANGLTFWAHHEYAEGNSWRTWVQAFTPDVVVGDLDGDGHVSTSDLLILLASWGPCGDCNNCPADLDGNCVVGTSDLLILLSNWG